jgi:divalent metal cation (Fe/Co/Zn/Cd) transporter
VAGSISLVAFGIDSFIELASAGVLVWRLSVELKRGRAFSEKAEQIASRIAGGLLFALAAYVVAAALGACGNTKARSFRGPVWW